jgi:predicted phosphodiesterase
MQIALLSDIHGCPIALEAVLKDIAAQGGADQYWVLGDLVDRGYDPAGVLQMVRGLPNVVCTFGNTDGYVLNRYRPFPSFEDAAADPSLWPRVVQVEQGISWTQGCLARGDHLEWLAALPLEARLTLPDGTRLLGVHASPLEKEVGLGIRPYMTDAQISDYLGSDCGADLVVVGHTHAALERRIGGVHVVNLGRVGMPAKDDLRASYGLLRATPEGYRLELRYVPYDTEAVIAALRRSNNPIREFIIGFYQGLYAHIWERQPGH